MKYRLVRLLTFACGLWTLAPAAMAQTPETLTPFLRELWPDAQARGITQQTFDRAFLGLTPDPSVIALTRREPEYGKPIGAYIDGFVSKSRVETGARKAAEWASTLAAVEKAYGVDRFILLALWGVETSYGGHKDRFDVIRSLATLAQAQYRAPYFRNELLVSLRILQEDHIAREAMRGSWAGAMGQPQFMPSSFFDYAVDFSGDGKRDIWTNVPDVLGSEANYMRKRGWKPGVPWGFEVVIPSGFDAMQSRGSYAQWTARGVKRADGGTFPAEGDATLLFPSGARGPAFLLTENFVAIKTYNDSDPYALAVAHLADRLRGGRPLQTAWPADDPQLSRKERVGLQHKLKELGYTVRDFAGRLDFDMRDAIRVEQNKRGMRPDGHPTKELLERFGIQVP
jgi:lytic murein transglycosylase